MVIGICVQMYMEVDEIFNGNEEFREIRQKQIFLILNSLSILSGITLDDAHKKFSIKYNEDVRDFRKSSRVYDGEDIINQIFNEKES